jgi:hypothetical protein
VTVRFGELKGLTSLPVNRVRDQFRYEVVSTVLPVWDGANSRETLLVATPPMLALLTPVRVPPGHWVTRWAPWDRVTIADPGSPWGQDDDVYRLGVLVGTQQFNVQLRGEVGRKALRDFVVAFRLSQPRNAARQ